MKKPVMFSNVKQQIKDVYVIINLNTGKIYDNQTYINLKAAQYMFELYDLPIDTWVITMQEIITGED